MQVTKIKVKNFWDIPEKIEEILRHNINSQIYINIQLSKQFGTYNHELYKKTGTIDCHSIYPINRGSNYHYGEGLVKSFNKTTGCAFDKTLIIWDLVSNFEDYDQLVNFKMKDINYTHYLVKCNHIVFID